MATVRVYYKGQSGTSMDIPSGDLSYWQGQGWTTSTSSAPAAPVSTPQSSSSSSSSPSSQKATLTSSDGLYKVVVDVGSSQANQLLSSGWKVGATGKTTTTLNTALSYQPSSASSSSTANAQTQKATLTSSDGLYKVVVDVGSSQANQLLSAGWKVGATGKTTTTLNTALSYKPAAATSTNSTSYSTTIPENQQANAKTIQDPGGIQYTVPISFKTPAGWTDLMTSVYVKDTSQLKTPQLATLWLDGKSAIVAVGSNYASELQTQGWGLTQNTATVTEDPNAKLAEAEAAAVTANNMATAIPVRDGNLVLVKFSDDPTPSDNTTGTSTIWIYNSTDKSYRAFLSPEAVQNFLGATDEEINNSIITLPTTAIDNTDWQGSFLPKVEAIQNDGTVPGGYSYDTSVSGNDTPNSTGLNTLYGKTKNATLEQSVANMIGTYFTTIKLKGGISQSSFDTIVNDPTTLAKYINALAYGGYTPGDIYRDVKAKELAASGNTAYANYKGFDENLAATTWYGTEEGQDAQNDAQLAPNASWDIDMSFFDNPIFTIPASAFSTLRETIDWNSDEFKEKASQIEASYYDLMEQKATAETEQEKALADNNWEIFKTTIEKNYGIKLSNNANTAWGQLQQMFTGGTERGLGNSGVMQEVVDKYLKDVRRNDQLLRDEKTEKTDLEYRNYLLKSGTPDEIATFINSNPEKAKTWGLVPGDDVKAYFDYNSLKEKYPSLTEEELRNIQSMLIDDNGNYRSELYQNLYSNKYNLSEQKKTYQQQKLYEQELLEEEKAYAPYTQTNPFSSYYPEYAQLPETDANSVLAQTNSTNTGTTATSSAAQSASVNTATNGQNATLSSPDGKYKTVVTVGSLQSNYLTSLGWKVGATGTKAVDYKTAVSMSAIPNNPARSGSSATTSTTPTATTTNTTPVNTTNTDSKWGSFSTQYDKSTYQPIANPDQVRNYYNVQNPGSGTLYGIPLSSMTKVTSPTYLSKYKEDQVYRAADNSIYLTPGTKKLW